MGTAPAKKRSNSNDKKTEALLCFASLAPYNATDNKEIEGKRLLNKTDNAELGKCTDGV